MVCSWRMARRYMFSTRVTGPLKSPLSVLPPTPWKLSVAPSMRMHCPGFWFSKAGTSGPVPMSPLVGNGSTQLPCTVNSVRHSRYQIPILKLSSHTSSILLSVVTHRSEQGLFVVFIPASHPPLTKTNKLQRKQVEEHTRMDFIDGGSSRCAQGGAWLFSKMMWSCNSMCSAPAIAAVMKSAPDVTTVTTVAGLSPEVSLRVGPREVR